MGQFIVRVKGNAIEHDQWLLTSEGFVLPFFFFFKFKPHPELLIHLNTLWYVVCCHRFETHVNIA